MAVPTWAFLRQKDPSSEGAESEEQRGLAALRLADTSISSMASGTDAADVLPVVSMSSRATPDRSMTLDSALGRVIAAQRNTRVPCMATTMRPTGSVSESFDWNSSVRSMYSGMS